MRVVVWALAAVVAAGSLVALGRGNAVVDDVLTVPDEGEARPALLADGTPIFVVAPPDGEVVVVEAVVPVNETPLQALVGWCPEAGVFTQPHTGLVFHADGRPTQTGATPGRGPFRQPGLDATGLVRREVLGVASGGQSVRVGDPLPPDPSTELTTVTRPPRVCGGYPPNYEEVPGRPDPASALVTHDVFATPLTETALTPGVHLVEGRIVRNAETAHLCAPAAPTPAPAPAATPVTCSGPVVPGLGGTGVDGITTTLAGALLVGVAGGGEIADVALLPRTRWHGAGFQALDVFDATIRSVTPRAGIVDLQLPGRDARGPAIVPDDLRCQVTVTGRLVLGLELPAETVATLEEDFPAGRPVEVVADTSTCRVLRLEPRAT